MERQLTSRRCWRLLVLLGVHFYVSKVGSCCLRIFCLAEKDTYLGSGQVRNAGDSISTQATLDRWTRSQWVKALASSSHSWSDSEIFSTLSTFSSEVALQLPAGDLSPFPTPLLEFSGITSQINHLKWTLASGSVSRVTQTETDSGSHFLKKCIKCICHVPGTVLGAGNTETI